MGKNVIKLSESQLRRIISECISEELKENDLEHKAIEFLENVKNPMVYCRSRRKLAQALNVQLTPETIDKLDTAVYLFLGGE